MAVPTYSPTGSPPDMGQILYRYFFDEINTSQGVQQAVAVFGNGYLGKWEVSEVAPLSLSLYEQLRSSHLINHATTDETCPKRKIADCEFDGVVRW